MTPEQLDERLRKLSDSEIEYKNGTKRADWFKHIRKGDKYPCIGLGFGYKSASHIVLPQLNISINRNSRFSPVPVHVHDFIEISYVYSGSVPEQVMEDRLLLKTGQTIIIDTNAPHAIDALSEEDILINLLIPKSYLFGNLFSHLSADSVLSRFFVNSVIENTRHDKYLLFQSENSRRIRLSFVELCCEFLEPSGTYEDIIRNLLALIVSELMNVYEKQSEKKEMDEKSGQFIPLMHYLEENFQTCSRESTAEHFHMNEKSLTRLIKKNTGMTYKQLIQSIRLTYAAKLLKNTELVITDIIHMCGYENMNFFYRIFQNEYGMSPNEYRNLHVPKSQ